MSSVPRIKLTDVHKAFGPKKVLKGVDLEVAAGESVVIVGGSGTGKSVTLKCILGLLRPDQGSIQIDGQEIVGLGERDREKILHRIGMLFQFAALFDSMTVWENVAFGLVQGGSMSPEEARPIALEKLALVGLDRDTADQSPAALSGGMRKRVGLARAIATEPEIIFFDEPTTGLDPLMGDIINDLIVTCVEETGASTLTITHDMSSARMIGDRVAMLYGGRIIWDGPARDIDNSGNEIFDQFVHGREDGPFEMVL